MAEASLDDAEAGAGAYDEDELESGTHAPNLKEQKVHRTVRDAAGVQSLIDSYLPDDADLYALVPCRADLGLASAACPTFSERKKRKRDFSFGKQAQWADVYPGPAYSAAVMAERLQQFLQEQATFHSTASSAQEVALSMADATPSIKVTAADIAHVALQDGAFANLDTDTAYRTHCVNALGVRLVRPDELFAWATECSEFWAGATFQEHILRTCNVYVTLDDLRNAASQSQCADYAAQAFFDAEAVRGTWVIGVPNMNMKEFRQVERDGPYYAWKVLHKEADGGAVAPWDGVVSGADFAYRLQFAFASEQLSPALRYDACAELHLPYVHCCPEEPDEALVARLSRGEWGFLEKMWGLRVVSVQVYAWVFEPFTPSGTLTFSAEVRAAIPDALDRFTAAEMAADMSQYFHVDADAADVEDCVLFGAPKRPEVRKAWDVLANALQAAGGTLALQRL